MMNSNGTEKLVRDAIPQLLESEGLTPIIRVAGLDEYRRLLMAKLQEETDEVREALDVPPESLDIPAVVEEIADVMEVLFAIATDLGVERDEIEKVRIAKAAARGGFAERIVWFDDRAATGE